jgi:hypothetical protein
MSTAKESLFDELLDVGSLTLQGLAVLNKDLFKESLERSKVLVDEAKSLGFSYDDFVSYISGKFDVSPDKVTDPFLEIIEPHWRSDNV